MMTSWYQAIDRTFIQPEQLVWLWLVACAVLAMIVGELLRIRWRRRLFALARDPHAIQLGNPRPWFLSGIKIMALTLVVLALADPRAGVTATEVKTSNLQIVCLLDRSRSMMARDVLPSRFEASRNVVREVVNQAGGAAVALVTFAGDARIDVPLTRDYQGLLDRIGAITPGNNPVTGSNLAAGIATAATCFAERIESPKILIVVTDGETHGIEPDLHAGVLPPGTEVLVLGVGDPREGAPIPLSAQQRSGASDDRFLTHEGRTVRSKANLERLRRLAERLGGDFQRIDTDSSATAVFDILRRAESAAGEGSRLAYRRQAAPWFHWLLLVAAGLLCLETIIPFKRPAVFNKPRPTRSVLAERFVLSIFFPVLTTAIALADDPPGTSVASPRTARELSQLYNRGVQAYRAGRWNEAEALFRTVSRQAEDSLKTKSNFNLASTHYAIVNRGGLSKREAISRLEAAIDLLRQTVADGERTEDARANVEIIYRRLLQIEQHQPDSEEGPSPPSDRTPESGDGSGDGGAGDTAGDRGENGDSEQDGPQTGDRDTSDQPPGNGSPADDNGQRSAEPDGGDSSGSRPPDAGRPPEAPTEPLTDQQAEDQLRRIRQRAQERQSERDKEEPADAAPITTPPGLPW